MPPSRRPGGGWALVYWTKGAEQRVNVHDIAEACRLAARIEHQGTGIADRIDFNGVTVMLRDNDQWVQVQAS